MKNRLIKGLTPWDIPCDSGQCDDLILYLEELLRWNKQINLTSITDPTAALEKHLIDSLLISNYIREAERLIDMGSGAGLPALPLAIIRKDLDITSVDSVGKKINFQKHMKRKLRLRNICPTQGRVEVLAQDELYSRSFDVVTARAFTALSDIAAVADLFLKDQGRIVAMKGADGEKELATAEKELTDLGFTRMHVDSYQLPFSLAKRTMIVIEK